MGGATLKRRIRWIMADDPPRPLGAPGGALLTAALAAALAVPVLAGVYTAAPAAAARVLVALGGPIAAALPSLAPSTADRSAPARRPAPPEPARIGLAAAPAMLTEAAAYAPPPERSIRLARQMAVPAFQPAVDAAATAVTVAVADDAPAAPADPAFLRALAERTAYVTGADLGPGRLDLRGAGACPTGGVMDAERRLGGQAVSTAFDGRVRRFVDEAAAGKVGPRDLSPAMAEAVDAALPALQPALASRFGGPGAARLIGEDRRGRDVYLVRPGGTGYALVVVDDLGQIDAALFCAAG
jgi:hypothetical protein